MTERKGNRLLIVLVIAALLTVGAGFTVMALFVRLPDLPAPAPGTPAKIAVLPQRPGDSSIPLFSHAPLFQPTAVSASRVALPKDVEDEANAMVIASPAKYMFPAEGMALAFGEPFADRFAMPRSAAESTLVSDVQVNHFEGIGRVVRPLKAVPSRLGFLEVVEAGTGRVVQRTSLEASDAAVPANSWQPLQLYVAVDESGLVAEPTIVESSGSGQVDTFFRAFVAKTINIGKRLEPGFYRLRVGP